MIGLTRTVHLVGGREMDRRDDVSGFCPWRHPIVEPSDDGLDIVPVHRSLSFSRPDILHGDTQYSAIEAAVWSR